MVQGRLLTTQPRGVHGDGGAPGGDSSLRQGARTTSPGSPDLETTETVVQRGDREKTCILGVSSTGVLYRRRGQPGAPPGSHAPPARPGPRARHQGAWVPGGGPLAPPTGVLYRRMIS